MANIHDDPAALKALQDDIYRDKVLRARGMTVEERLAEAFELDQQRLQPDAPRGDVATGDERSRSWLGGGAPPDGAAQTRT